MKCTKKNLCSLLETEIEYYINAANNATNNQRKTAYNNRAMAFTDIKLMLEDDKFFTEIYHIWNDKDN